MSSGHDIRWKQRLENFARALALLRSALENGPQALNPLEKEGAVHTRYLPAMIELHGFLQAESER